MNEVSQISSHLFLSSALVVTERQLQELGITLVVNATKELPLVPLGDNVKVIKVAVADKSTENLFQHFDSVTRIIRQAYLNNERTLVHCLAGVSRSASICIAYLMRYHKLNLAKAVDVVRKARPIVRPNSGFLVQLLKWEEALKEDLHSKCTNLEGSSFSNQRPDESDDVVYISRAL